jgi:hypothetical protein
MIDDDDDFLAEPAPDIGPCCCCGGTENVRNIVLLSRRCSVPGTGWFCVVCGLPADGASYVACDRCLEADAPPREVILGYPNDRRREPIENLSPEPFEHDMTKHEPED